MKTNGDFQVQMNNINTENNGKLCVSYDLIHPTYLPYPETMN